MNECPLCKHERITHHYHEDDKIWVADCSTHRNKKLCVLKRHTSEPTEEEDQHMRSVMEGLFPGIKLRGPASLKGHFHYHEA